MLNNPLRSKPGIRKELIILPMLLFVLFSSIYFLFLWKSTPGNILERAVAHMGTREHSLAVKINEEGEDYKLHFEGNISDNGVLYGKIKDYDLELCRTAGGKLLVKDLIDGSWKEPAEVGLQSLTALIDLPFDFLGTCVPIFQKAVFLDKPREANALISLQIPPEFLKEMQPENTDASWEDLIVNCKVSVQRKTYFIDAVNLSYIDKDGHEELFRRSYSFYPLEKSDFKTVYSSKL